MIKMDSEITKMKMTTTIVGLTILRLVVTQILLITPVFPMTMMET